MIGSKSGRDIAKSFHFERQFAVHRAIGDDIDRLPPERAKRMRAQDIVYPYGNAVLRRFVVVEFLLYRVRVSQAPHDRLESLLDDELSDPGHHRLLLTGCLTPEQRLDLVALDNQALSAEDAAYIGWSTPVGMRAHGNPFHIEASLDVPTEISLTVNGLVEAVSLRHHLIDDVEASLVP